MDRTSPNSFGKMARLYKACGEPATKLGDAAMAVRIGLPTARSREVEPKR